MMGKKCAAAIVLILILALLCGCSEKKENSSEWLGVWRTEDLSVAEDLFAENMPGKGSITLTLSADGNHDPEKMGNYTCEADITYNGDSKKGAVSGQYAVENGTLYLGEGKAVRQGDTIVLRVDGKEIVFKKQ